MELLEVIAHCLRLPEAEETTPFGPDVLVYKVGGKMFALAAPDEFPARVNLKYNPDRSLEVRDRYAAIQPGWHMNKKHWNTLVLDGTLPPELIQELIAHSYQLVSESLAPKKKSLHKK